MRNPNGYGGVVCMAGNRRRPYRVRITTGWDAGVQKLTTLGYYPTQADALMALAEYNRAPWALDMRNITFRQVYDQWSPRRLDRFPSTRRLTESIMEHCRPIWDRPMRDLRTAELQRLVDGMDDHSPAYLQKVRSLFHDQYRWCMQNDILFRDYSLFVEVAGQDGDGRRRIFSPAELTRLRVQWQSGEMAGEPRKYAGKSLGETLPVLFYTGMRVGELLKLQCKDVHFDARYIDLHGTKTKAARRIVPLCDGVLPYIRRGLDRGCEFFVTVDGEPLTYSQYKYSWFDKVMAANGMAHTPHDTRHTFVSAMDTAGVSRTAIKFIVGHSLSRDVTDLYTHKALPELLDAVNKLRY